MNELIHFSKNLCGASVGLLETEARNCLRTHSSGRYASARSLYGSFSSVIETPLSEAKNDEVGGTWRSEYHEA
jgi:hypothetical protein